MARFSELTQVILVPKPVPSCAGHALGTQQVFNSHIASAGGIFFGLFQNPCSSYPFPLLLSLSLSSHGSIISWGTEKRVKGMNLTTLYKVSLDIGTCSQSGSTVLTSY